MTSPAHTQIAQVIKTGTRRLRRLAGTAGGDFPNYGDGTGYVLGSNDNWLAGFWTGLLWLAYAADGDRFFREKAEQLLPTFARRLDQHVHITHDLGFLFTLSARAQWQLTGDAGARDLALRAARLLLGRFRRPGEYIQAWGAVGDPQEGGRIIADTMMNLPLLFWAAAETGESTFHHAAVRHTEHSIRHLLRADGSSFHTFFFDQQTGAPRFGATHQGYSDSSWWARGHAWLIYGLALAAQWADSDWFLETAGAAACAFWNALPASRIPAWDLRLPPEAPLLLDSSAAAIALCGMQRIADLTGDAAMAARAETLLQALLNECLEEDPAGQGLLKHGALHVPKGWAPDAYLIFGDYFFFEALLNRAGQSPDLWGPGEN